VKETENRAEKQADCVNLKNPEIILLRSSMPFVHVVHDESAGTYCDLAAGSFR
jgi:hypothetical protein